MSWCVNVRGQKLAILEAMKMEQALLAPFDGIVTDLEARRDKQVREAVVLMRIASAEES